MSERTSDEQLKQMARLQHVCGICMGDNPYLAKELIDARARIAELEARHGTVMQEMVDAAVRAFDVYRIPVSTDEDGEIDIAAILEKFMPAALTAALAVYPGASRRAVEAGGEVQADCRGRTGGANPPTGAALAVAGDGWMPDEGLFIFMCEVCRPKRYTVAAVPGPIPVCDVCNRRMIKRPLPPAPKEG